MGSLKNIEETKEDKDHSLLFIIFSPIIGFLYIFFHVWAYILAALFCAFVIWCFYALFCLCTFHLPESFFDFLK